MNLHRAALWCRHNWPVTLGALLVLFGLLDALAGWSWESTTVLEFYGGQDRAAQLERGNSMRLLPPPWFLFYLLGQLFIGLGLWRLGKGLRRRLEAELDQEVPFPPGTRPATQFYPRFIIRELVVAAYLVGFVFIIAALMNPSQIFEPSLTEESLHTIEAPADPFETPPGILPEWYFITSFFMLQLMPPWMALMGVMGVFILGLVAVPFLDRTRQKHPLLRPHTAILGYWVVVLWLVLTLIGEKVLEWRPWEWSV